MSEIVGYLFGTRLGRRRAEKRAALLQEQGKVQASVIVVAGEARGIGTTWTSREWDIGPGSMGCRSVLLVIEGVDRAFRSPTPREAWDIDPEAQIYSARTPTGSIEVALMPEQAKWALGVIDPRQ
ncbi:hypothetical protein ACFVQ3_11215 [Oerskovia sp. NPDC057915]|uniref:hypothetical protein n=1 Tax=Oerskovia sp. NPDC057915 TaxID=3346280 RepID=UPI0036DD23D8